MIQTKTFERDRYFGLRNAWTGQFFVVDTFQKHQIRLKTRIFDWIIGVEKWQNLNPGLSRVVMIRLSYRMVSDYRPGHIGDYLRNLKKLLGEDLIAFAWVAELQQRKALHYHVCLLVLRGTKIPMPDKKGYWTHGSSRIQTWWDNPTYLAKYCGKENQKDYRYYPKGVRTYAVSFRPVMGIKPPENRSHAQILPKIKTSEGGSVWVLEAHSNSLGWVRLFDNGTWFGDNPISDKQYSALMRKYSDFDG